MKLLWQPLEVETYTRPDRVRTFTPDPSTGIEERFELNLSSLWPQMAVSVQLYDRDHQKVVLSKTVSREEFWGAHQPGEAISGNLQHIPSGAWQHLPKVSECMNLNGIRGQYV